MVDKRSRHKNKKKRCNERYLVTVENLPQYVTVQQLMDVFREFGTIFRADIPLDSSVSGFS